MIDRDLYERPLSGEVIFHLWTLSIKFIKYSFILCSLEVRESKPDGQIDGPFKSTLVGILVDKKKMHVLGQGLAIESEIDVNIYIFSWFVAF